MTDSLEEVAEELLECLQRFIYVLKGRETMDEKRDRSVYEILREIKKLAGKNPNNEIADLCDEAARTIEKYMIGWKICKVPLSPLNL